MLQSIGHKKSDTIQHCTRTEDIFPYSDLPIPSIHPLLPHPIPGPIKLQETFYSELADAKMPQWLPRPPDLHYGGKRTGWQGVVLCLVSPAYCHLSKWLKELISSLSPLLAGCNSWQLSQPQLSELLPIGSGGHLPLCTAPQLAPQRTCSSKVGSCTLPHNFVDPLA